MESFPWKISNISGKLDTVFPSLVSAETIVSQDKICAETNQGWKQIEGGNYCKSPFFGIFY